MSVIYILLFISLIMGAIFLGIFIFNLKSGQFDDDFTPAVRILFEDTHQPEVVKVNSASGKPCSKNCPTCKCQTVNNFEIQPSHI